MMITYNAYFRHRRIPTTFWLSATDWGYWKLYQRGDAYLTIADLHENLGIHLSVLSNSQGRSFVSSRITSLFVLLKQCQKSMARRQTPAKESFILG